MDLEREKILVEKAKNSREAFGELYDMYYDQIFGYALRHSADIEIAKDVTSAVFFKALKSIKKFRWQGVSLSHWLFRIANREIIDRYNKGKREVSYSRSTSGLPGTREVREEMVLGREELRKHDDYLDLQNYISKLPSKYQEVITLRYFEDMDMGEIARILRKPEGTVKSLLHRGIDRLRKMMESQG